MNPYRVAGVYPTTGPEPGGTPAPIPSAVPVFLGLARKGDPLRAHPIRSVNAFVDTYGTAVKGGYLAAAIEGFFANGGRQCHVMRLPEVSTQALSKALGGLEALDEIDLVCAPDLITVPASRALGLQRLVLAHCSGRGDRFAILDSHPDGGAGAEGVTRQRDALQDREGYGALYHPWIRRAPLRVSLAGPGFIPPCGDVAGVYSRTDSDAGPHRAPANRILEGVVDLSVVLSASEQDRLDGDSGGAVNLLRAFPGRGIRVWGARTLGTDPNWRYVNVRRLFIEVYRWIERNLRGVVFEPNDPRLWARITDEINGYLDELFLRGAMKGASSQEAYYVRCDADTNPQAVREAGWVITEIGLAPAIPGEFIVVRLIHRDSGLTTAAA